MNVVTRRSGFQARVKSWVLACFGKEVASDRVERIHRYIEESLELAQALNCSKEEVLKLVDYVYRRPKGTVQQEIGCVMLTLAALCSSLDEDMYQAGELELERVWGKMDEIRTKQASKPKNSPLPQ